MNIPEILKNAKTWADELKAAKWKRIELNASGRKIDPVYGLAWKDPKTKQKHTLKNAYSILKHTPETKPTKPKKP